MRLGEDQGSCFIQVEILGKRWAGFLVQISTVELLSYEHYGEKQGCFL